MFAAFKKLAHNVRANAADYIKNKNKQNVFLSFVFIICNILVLKINMKNGEERHYIFPELTVIA